MTTSSRVCGVSLVVFAAVWCGIEPPAEVAAVAEPEVAIIHQVLPTTQHEFCADAIARIYTRYKEQIDPAWDAMPDRPTRSEATVRWIESKLESAVKETPEPILPGSLPPAVTGAADGSAPPAIQSVAPSFDLLYFTAGWCPGCVSQTPIVASVGSEYRIRVVDCDAEPGEVRRHGIKTIPAFVTADGKVHKGPLSRAKLLKLLGKADETASSASAVTQCSIARVTSGGEPHGTAVCIGRLGSDSLYGICDHQVRGELHVSGKPARVLWRDREGINDAAIVAVNTGRDGGTLRTGHTGPASVYGFPGLGGEMRGFSGTAAGNGQLISRVPDFPRPGLSGGGVYAADGSLVGIYSGFVTDEPTKNTYTPIEVYVAAIEDMGGTCDVAMSVREACELPVDLASLQAMDTDGLRGVLWSRRGELPSDGTVVGMTVKYHLVHDHGFDDSRISGLTEAERHQLHQLAHTLTDGRVTAYPVARKGVDEQAALPFATVTDWRSYRAYGTRGSRRRGWR